MNFVTKGFVNIFGQSLAAAISLLTGILLSRWLLPAGIGQYQLVITALLITGGITTLGVGQATIFYINRKKIDITVVATVAFKFSLVMGLANMLIVLALLCYRPYFGEIPFWVILICGIQGMGLTLMATLYPVLIAPLEIKKYIIVRLIPSLVLLVLVILGILLGLININYAWVASSIAQISGVLTVLWFLRRWISLRMPFEWKLFKSLAAYGAKINLTYIVRVLNGEIGLLLLRYFSRGDFTEIGYFGRAVRLATILLLLSESLSPLLYSKWSSLENTPRRLQTERVSRVFWALLVLLIVALELLAGYLVAFLYGSAFLPAVPIMRIILIGVGARFLLSPLFSFFSSSGKPLLTSLVLSINLALMSVLMIFLVPTYMGIGAALAFTLSNLAGLAIAYTLSCLKFGVRLNQCVLINSDDLKYCAKALGFKKSP